MPPTHSNVLCGYNDEEQTLELLFVYRQEQFLFAVDNMEKVELGIWKKRLSEGHHEQM